MQEKMVGYITIVQQNFEMQMNEDWRIAELTEKRNLKYFGQDDWARM